MRRRSERVAPGLWSTIRSGIDDFGAAMTGKGGGKRGGNRKGDRQAAVTRGHWSTDQPPATV